MNKDAWLAFTLEQKQVYLRERLQLLLSIRNHTHSLSGTKGQGRLRELKKIATQEMEQVFSWENDLT